MFAAIYIMNHVCLRFSDTHVNEKIVENKHEVWVY